jgi:signal transduction histidine kinase
VARLLARGVAAGTLFDAVSREVGRLLGGDFAGMARFEDDWVVTVGTWAADGAHPPLPPRWPFVEGDAATTVAQTCRAARWDDWANVPGPIAKVARDVLRARSTVGTPIVVEGRVWGALAVHTRGNSPFPPDTEARMEQFTELVATAVAHEEARGEVARLADEQAALRRVATLVAREGSATTVLGAIAEECGRLFGSTDIALVRYEGDHQVVRAIVGEFADVFPVGSAQPLGGDNVGARVFRTGTPVRIDDYAAVGGGPDARLLGLRSLSGTPITVHGGLWGALLLGTTGDEVLPPGTEARVGQFTELMATAIANADARDQLTASRARLLTASDDARRRVVRDLHDGAQQRLVHTALTLSLARRALRQSRADDADALVRDALGYVNQAHAELRALASGILPSVLALGGLRAGVRTLVERFDLPVAVDMTLQRFPAELEASAYFIVAEALTNVAKHARATRAEIKAYVNGDALHFEIRDDVVGGADAGGNGLLGLADRATALGGRLAVDSPAGGGTVLVATLPLPRSGGPTGYMRKTP